MKLPLDVQNLTFHTNAEIQEHYTRDNSLLCIERIYLKNSAKC